MGDMAEDFRALREHNRQRRNHRLEANKRCLEKLLKKGTGLKVRELTPYHYRFTLGGAFQVVANYWPSSGRFQIQGVAQSFPSRSPWDVLKAMQAHQSR